VPSLRSPRRCGCGINDIGRRRDTEGDQFIFTQVGSVAGFCEVTTTLKYIEHTGSGIANE